MSETPELLEVRSASLRFAGLEVLSNVSFTVPRGEILGIIGPNGAGKTTLFNVLSGLYSLSAGTVELEGRRISGLPPHEICRRGVARTFQIVRPFASATVAQNVEVAALYGRADPLGRQQAADRVAELLEFVDLVDKQHVPAAGLNWAELKRLEFARALAVSPKILLLDETFSGLTRNESARALDLVRRVRDDAGVTIIWIEHVMEAIVSLADRLIVLDHGTTLAEGNVDDVLRDPGVVDAYLGGEVL